MSTRRETLRILGTVSSTCAFPFAADQLYGQHESHSSKQAAIPKVDVFTEAEREQARALADFLIPKTDTPGAVEAGAVDYIEYVASKDRRLAKRLRSGLSELAKKRFAAMSEADREAFAAPRIEAADRKRRGAEFWRAFKSLTADGYYTSKTGLVDELGYKGNTVLAQFPTCRI